MMEGTGMSPEWFNQTTVHPLGLIALAISALSVFAVPRRFALVPLIVLACFVSPAQRLVVTTLDFNFLRILVLCGWIRVLMRRELIEWRWKPLDVAMLAWVLCATVTATLLHTTMAAFVNRLGLLYDAVGLYFLTRVVIRSWSDVRAVVQCTAVIAIPVAAAFIYESSTGRNLFAIFGGVPEVTTIRNDRLRCRGPFAHPILAGAFWASLIPLFLALWPYRRLNRWLSIIGVAMASIIVFTTSSATPLGGLIVAISAMSLFVVRRWASWAPWLGVTGMIAAQLVMINPIWHLLARFELVPGATGWYRFKLIDAFFCNIGEWWLVGTEAYTQWWNYGFDAITNEYILQGVEGGALTLVLFIAIIVVAFQAVGGACRRCDIRHQRIKRMRPSATRHGVLRRRAGANTFMAWSFGAALCVHCCVFLGVSYFDQSILMWYGLLGMIGSVCGQRIVLRRSMSTQSGKIAHRPSRRLDRRRVAPAPAL